MYDVRLGEALGKVRLEGEGAGQVAALSFRTDNEAQTLAVASTSGHVALFDLASENKLLHLVRNAHEGPVGGLEWVPGQPLMVTSGGDNSVKVRFADARPLDDVQQADFPNPDSNGSWTPRLQRLAC